MADDHDDGELTLKVGESSLRGWTRIRVTRGVERMPSDFDIELTDINPDDSTSVSVQPGDRCQVMLGADLVITGFVNMFAPTIDKAAHSIRVSGRSLSQDLVDASAEKESGQIGNTTALAIAQEFAKAYPSPNGLTVSCAVDPGPKIPQFNLNRGDSAYSIIERVCRYATLIAYDEPNGNILLNHAGKVKAAGAIKQGENVERATYTWNDSELFSEYDVYGLSTSVMQDSGGGFDQVFHHADPNMNRNRKKYIVAEAGDAGYIISKQRAIWESARRVGRAHKVQVTVDSWRDSAKKLWEPNTLVTVDLPILKIVNTTYCISEVSFIRDQNGTHADLVLMLPESFVPQPILLVPTLRDANAATPGAPGTTNPPGARR